MQRAPSLLLQQLARCAAANSSSTSVFAAAAPYATKAAPPKGAVVQAKDWKAVALPKDTVADIPTTTTVGQAFVGDLRSTSGLGLGDGLKTHTDKWLQGGGQKTPMEYIQSAEPIKVHGAVVASHGSEFLFFFVFSC